MRRSTTVCNNPYSGAQYVLDTPLLGLLVLVGVQANGDKKSRVSKCILASGIDRTCQCLWQAKKSSTRRASDSTSLREFTFLRNLRRLHIHLCQSKGCLTSAGQPTCRILIKGGHLRGESEFARAKCAHKHILTDKRFKKFKVSRLYLTQLCNALKAWLGRNKNITLLSVTKLEVGGKVVCVCVWLISKTVCATCLVLLQHLIHLDLWMQVFPQSLVLILH